MTDWSLFADQITKIIFDIVYVGLVFGTIIVIVLDNRSPVRTIAWILVLIFLPLIGLVFYFFFGRTNRRERIIGRKSYNRILKKPMAEYLSQEVPDIPEKYDRLIRLFWGTNQALPFHYNTIETYTDGYSKLYALIRELRKAKDHIHLQYYIFQDDPVGRLVHDVLIDKAKEGVEIRVLYDDVGSWSTPHEFFEEMRDAGIEVRSFLKVRFPTFTSKVNYRNHRKVVVIDGTVGFIGGMNLAERYVKGVSWGIWRDTHIMVKGRAVHGLQTSFLLDWYFVDRTLITASRYFPCMEACGNSMVQMVTSDPVGPWKEIMQGLAMAIASSRKYFYIQTPYFLPTEVMLESMQTAALAGVDIRLMIPEKADNRITNWASHSYLADVLQAGVKVYFYKKGFLHSKLIVSDDALASIGSANIDFRSFEHNFEINAFIYDEVVARQMKELFHNDQRDCIQIHLKTWSKRPYRQKALESVMRLLAPLL